jgi:hypothetical protein
MILMGSNYFFHQYPDFKSTDIDKIELVDTNEFKEKRVIRGQGKDYFYLKRKPKDQLIQDALKSNLPMVVGKFLIPEFNKQINFTIEDLPKLQPLIDKLDEKHKYEEIIYNAYIENKSFTLTEEQRDAAYRRYKEAR